MSLKFKAGLCLNFGLCGVARFLAIVCPLKYLTPYFGTCSPNAILSTIISSRQHHKARAIGKSIQLAAERTPWNSNCLTQAMVAVFWCRFFKIPCIFYIGFAKSEDERSGYKAHAWVKAGAVAVTGGDGLLNYQVVSSYILTYKISSIH